MCGKLIVDIDIKINPKTDTPKSAKSKASASPKENKKNIPMPNERDYNKDFSLSFGELYEYHINIIEQKTNLKINDEISMKLEGLEKKEDLSVRKPIFSFFIFWGIAWYSSGYCRVV